MVEIITRICKRLRSTEIDSKESIPPDWESITGLHERFTNTGSRLAWYPTEEEFHTVEKYREKVYTGRWPDTARTVRKIS